MMRKNTKKVDAIIIAVIVLIIAAIVLKIFLSKDESESTSNNTSDTVNKLTSAADYNGKIIGILTGSSFEPPTLENFPKSQYLYFDSISDLILALQQNKIDGFVHDEPVLRNAFIDYPDLTYFPEMLKNDIYSFAFPKDSEKHKKLLNQFNEMIAELTSSGEIEKMKKIWFSSENKNYKIDKSGLTGENGKLTFAVNSTNVPCAMIVDGELEGYAVELAYKFCRKYGYDCQFEQGNIASCLAGITSGKYDICANNCTVTKERQESMLFSDPVYYGGITLAVRSKDVNLEGAGKDSDSSVKYTDYIGKKVGIFTGSNFENASFEYLPNSEYMYFDSTSDLILAVIQNKIDCFICDEPIIRAAVAEQPELGCLSDVISAEDYSFIFDKNPKSEKLLEQFDQMISEMMADGSLEELNNKWFAADRDKKTVDKTGLTGENGTIKVFSDPGTPPFAFVANNEIQGIQVEMVYMFARKYGYNVDYEVTTVASGLAGISSGVYDVGANNFSITPERAETMNFSIPFYSGGLTLAVRASDLNGEGEIKTENDKTETEKKSFIDSIIDSFERNFIREDRWKLILEGIGTTCLITLLTTIFGTILAFLVCMFRRTGSKLANSISNIYVKLLQGTPMVVLLMILYYVIFGKSGIDAKWVAVIGFTLNFGAYGSEIMKSGIDSIDGGQREAALALGYSENQAFFKFIFPQAAVRFLPVYRGELVSLLKSTSIVGYIAIQDLTKMSDIIRSRTYEAFFPLIVTAIIYFILAWIISIIMSFILNKTDPMAKKKRALSKAQNNVTTNEGGEV